MLIIIKIFFEKNIKMYSTNFEEWLTQTFLPCGVVYSTESAKKILSKNNLTASEFLRPFGDFNGKKEQYSSI